MTDRDSFEQTPYVIPAGATELILVRHGASEAFVEGSSFPILDGRSDPSLSEDGRAQARMVGERLRGESFAGLFVTSLRRTSETAAPLAESCGMDPKEIAELSEVSLGDLEGGHYRILAARGDPIVKRVFAEERWDVVPNGEDGEEFAARVRKGVEKVVRFVGPDVSAVVVVHGAVIGELCRQATSSRAFAFIHADNGSISRLVVGPDGRWLLRSFNDISHLTVRSKGAG